MNAQSSSTALTTATPTQRQIRVVTDEEPILDTGKFEHMQRIASVMARCALVPQSLRGDDIETAIANCFLVVNQAVRWGMDPFAVAQCVSVIQGKLCYEGKVVSAVMQKNGVNLSFKLNDKPGDALGVTVSGTLPGETEVRTVTGTVGAWKTGNKQWQNDPRAMLCYRGARAWSRIHNPAPMLGVYTPDELEDAGNSRAPRAIDRDDGPPAPPTIEHQPSPPTDQVVWEENGERPATAQDFAAPEDGSIPAYLDRTKNGNGKPAATVFDGIQWLNDLEGSLSGCESTADLTDTQRKVMLPAKSKASKDDWNRAEWLVHEAFKRINQTVLDAG